MCVDAIFHRVDFALTIFASFVRLQLFCFHKFCEWVNGVIWFNGPVQATGKLSRPIDRKRNLIWRLFSFCLHCIDSTICIEMTETILHDKWSMFFRCQDIKHAHFGFSPNRISIEFFRCNRKFKHISSIRNSIVNKIWKNSDHVKCEHDHECEIKRRKQKRRRRRGNEIWACFEHRQKV